MGLAFVSCLLKVKKKFGTVNPCFTFLRIRLIFCDLLIVIMLCNQSYPANKTLSAMLWLTGFCLFVSRIMLINTKKIIKYLKEIIIIIIICMVLVCNVC